MREALADPRLLGLILSGPSWAAWRALLIAVMGEVLTADERAIFTTLTGRASEPLEPVEELWGVIGRRGGKSRAMAVLAAYLGALVDYRDVLAIGERALIPVLAATTDQAATLFRYVAGIFEAAPLFGELVINRTADTLSLSTRVDIEVRAANFRTARGPTSAAVIADEAAFWRADDAANPDTEILNALRPSLATTGGPLIVISSPYARRGELHATWKRDYGPAGDPRILVVHGTSRDLNPTLPQRVVDRAMEKDPAAARAEYLAEFRTDVETLLSLESIEAATIPGRLELPPSSNVRYVAFTDPSGGSADSFTLAVAHLEGATTILDAVRERRPPFSPEAVVAEFAELLKSYGVATVTGDRYAGEWPRERFRAHGISYTPAEKTASELYGELLPLVNGGRVELLTHARLAGQLAALERRTSRAGRDSISHPPGGHDDIANAVAGALTLAASKRRPLVISEEILALSRQRTPYSRRFFSNQPAAGAFQ
jgi:hypothetical protein